MLCRNPLIMRLNLQSQYRTFLINFPRGYKYTDSSDIQPVCIFLIHKIWHVKPSLELS